VQCPSSIIITAIDRAKSIKRRRGLDKGASKCSGLISFLDKYKELDSLVV